MKPLFAMRSLFAMRPFFTISIPNLSPAFPDRWPSHKQPWELLVDLIRWLLRRLRELLDPQVDAGRFGHGR